MKRSCFNCETMQTDSCSKFWEKMGLKANYSSYGSFKDKCWHPMGSILVVDEKREEDDSERGD